MDDTKNRHIPHRVMIYGALVMLFVSLFTPLLGGSAMAANQDKAVGETLFEGVGHYAFATAGNNNAYRGEKVENNYDTSALIDPEDNSNLPQNWAQIRQRLEADGYSVTNLSGSYLDTKNGKVKLAALRSFDCTSERVNYIILIRPDGSYARFNYHDNVTQFINGQENPTGWYFVFYPELDTRLCNQASWSITSIYEEPGLEISHIKLINSDVIIAGSEYPDVGSNETYVMFDSPLTPNGDTQLVGVYIAAGARSWPIEGRTEDKTYVVLENNTESQLFESNYNGKTIFAGRSATDFANGTFNTVRSHNVKGGELDIFDETLDSRFFGNSKVLGFHIVKTGTNVLVPTLFGFRQVIEAPELTVTPVIPSEDPTHPIITIKNITEYTACSIKMEIPLSSIGEPTKITTDPSAGVTTSVTDGKLILEASSLAGSGEIKLFLTTPKKTDETLVIHPTVTYYASINGTCPVDISSSTNLAMTTEGEDKVYRIHTEYIDEDGKEIAPATYAYAHTGEEYDTEAIEVNGYALSVTPDNKSGIVDEEPIEVIYVYSKIVLVPDTGAFTNDNGYLVSISVSLVGLACVGLAAWFARRELASKHIDFK